MNIEEKAREMFQKWNESLQTGDKHNVTLMYTKDDDFLPTMNGRFRHGIGETEEYFDNFLKKKPIGKIMKDHTFGNENIIIHSGLYDFEVDDSVEGRINIEARFTFVYQKQEDGEYKIAHHHSSLKPISLS